MDSQDSISKWMFKRFQFIVLSIALVLISNTVVAGVEFKCSDRILIAPTLVQDPLISEQIANQVARHIQKKYISNLSFRCHTLIPYRDGMNDFDVVGITSNFQFDIQKISERPLGILFERTQFTYIVTISSQFDLSESQFETGEKLTLQLKFLQRKNLGRGLELAFQDSIAVNAEEIYAEKLDWLGKLGSRITPNSVGVILSRSQKTSRVESSETKSYDVEDSEQREAGIPLLSSVSFSRIDHPDSHPMWDYSLSLFPESALIFVNETLKIAPNSGNSVSKALGRKYIDLRYGAGCTYAVGQAAGFSIFGTTYIGIGPGLCYVHNKSNGRWQADYMDFSFQLEMGHRFFLNKNWYGAVEVTNSTFSHALYKDTDVSVHSFASAGLAVGYYVPDSEGVFGHLWDKLGL